MAQTNAPLGVANARGRLARLFEHRSGLFIWLQWVVANTVGWAVGVPLGIHLLVVSAVAGTFQVLVLRQHISRAWWWVFASVVGVVSVDVVTFTMDVHAARDVGGLVLMFSPSITQWLVLRRHVAHAWLWMLVSIAGWALSVEVLSFVGWHESQTGAVGAAMDGALLGAVYGGITGPMIAWLLRHPKSDPLSVRAHLR